MANLDRIVVIEADSPRDEVLNTQIKMKQVKDGVNDDVSVRFEVSRVSSSLEQEYVGQVGLYVRPQLTIPQREKLLILVPRLVLFKIVMPVLQNWITKSYVQILRLKKYI